MFTKGRTGRIKPKLTKMAHAGGGQKWDGRGRGENEPFLNISHFFWPHCGHSEVPGPGIGPTA